MGRHEHEWMQPKLLNTELFPQAGGAREQSECWTDGIVYHKLAPSSSDFKLECDSFKFLTAGSPP